MFVLILVFGRLFGFCNFRGGCVLVRLKPVWAFGFWIFGFMFFCVLSSCFFFTVISLLGVCFVVYFCLVGCRFCLCGRDYVIVVFFGFSVRGCRRGL